MDKELLYNQSGIKDETAYKAIINMRSGGSENMNGFDINKGEIWEAKDNNYGTRLVVVLCCYERYAATVMLQEQEPTSNAVQVRARDIMYADTGRLGWTFYDKMVDFVRALTAEEDQELRRAIGVALDLEVNKVSAATTAVALEARDKALEAAQQYENEVAELTLRLEAARAEADVLRRNIAESKEIIEKQERALETEAQQPTAQQGYVELVEEHSLREDLAAARQEAEIYKGLYERLLDKALG